MSCGKYWAVSICCDTMVASVSAPVRDSSYDVKARKMMKPSRTEKPGRQDAEHARRPVAVLEVAALGRAAADQQHRGHGDRRHDDHDDRAEEDVHRLPCIARATQLAAGDSVPTITSNSGSAASPDVGEGAVVTDPVRRGMSDAYRASAPTASSTDSGGPPIRCRKTQ